MKIKIAVGTTSENKLTFLKEVLKELGIESQIEISAVKTESKVSDQPITDAETKTGSLNRAKSALAMTKDASLGMGIEAGYHKNKDGRYEIFCYASIVDSKRFKISCKSHSFTLPKFHHEKVESGQELSDFVREYYEDSTNPAKEYLGKMIQSRKLIIQDSIRQALLQYFVKEDF